MTIQQALNFNSSLYTVTRALLQGASPFFTLSAAHSKWSFLLVEIADTFYRDLMEYGYSFSPFPPRGILYLIFQSRIRYRWTRQRGFSITVKLTRFLVTSALCILKSCQRESV
jgi:hypothetical protein